MTTHPHPGANPVADALAAALTGDRAAYAAHPSQLRSKLTRLLGDQAHTHRGDVHLVVTALDENVPSELRMAAPLTAADVVRHAQALAQARGWTQDAALRAVRYWAEAMDLPVSGDPAHVLPAESLRGSLSTSERSDPAEPEVSDADDRTAVPVPEPGPQATPQAGQRGWGDDGTNVPDAAETVLPRRDDPNATELPDRSSVVGASMLTPAPTPAGGALTPAPNPPSEPGTGGPAPWPTSSRFALAAALPKGIPFSGAYYTFRGRHPMLRVAVMVAFTVVVTLAVFLVPSPTVRMLIIGVGATLTLMVPLRLVRNGIMIVDDNGLAWFQAAPQPGPVELTARWDQVTLLPGNPPRLATPAGELWVKKRKGLLPALESRVSRIEGPA
jgi:hypothetical protein